MDGSSTGKERGEISVDAHQEIDVHSCKGGTAAAELKPLNVGTSMGAKHSEVLI